ncbi:hypothetical protein FA95DRAFT_1578032 [Auriscalpium vulgare]|uniref:Uncharacterized protein n=1 Tax=Auriscalpium vulgare TaxID=40419 RepID=A0ACB8R3S9_9AGAM|nr:hypothetical protein FA95DRAFT_1578032 [Auriscalpium vulgare]
MGGWARSYIRKNFKCRAKRLNASQLPSWLSRGIGWCRMGSAMELREHTIASRSSHSTRTQLYAGGAGPAHEDDSAGHLFPQGDGEDNDLRTNEQLLGGAAYGGPRGRLRWRGSFCDDVAMNEDGGFIVGRKETPLLAFDAELQKGGIENHMDRVVEWGCDSSNARTVMDAVGLRGIGRKEVAAVLEGIGGKDMMMLEGIGEADMRVLKGNQKENVMALMMKRLVLRDLKVS